MILAVTGTPGTGKTTATSELEQRLSADESLPTLEVIHLTEVIEAEGFTTGMDHQRDSAVADLERIADWLRPQTDVVIDSHLAHHFDADRVAILRCDPALLEQRLLERGEEPAKARENAESEALDVLLAEAVERHGLDSVYEIDTTDRSPASVADALESVIRGDREPTAGTVDFVGYLD